MTTRVLSLQATFGLAALGLATRTHAASAFDNESPWMLGDWSDKRTELSQQGYDFKLDTVVEVGSNLHGGYNHDQATRYADQFALGARTDLQKILGWHDAEFQLTLTNRNGDNLSNDRVSAPRFGTISSSQEVWGRGSVTRLTDMWYPQKFFDQKLSVKVGHFDEGEDFNTFPCDFQSLAFCGLQVGNWGGGIWYNWPISQWAMRVKYQLDSELFVQIGAFEQNPSNLENDNNFKLSGSGTQGAVLPLKLVWSPNANDLPGEYRLGYYYSTAGSSDIDTDSNGHYAALSGEDYASSSSKHGPCASKLRVLPATTAEAWACSPTARYTTRKPT